MIDRVFQPFDYEAAITGPGVEAMPIQIQEMNVWLSNGGTHLWHMDDIQPATAWEREIDQLMNGADGHSRLSEAQEAI